VRKSRACACACASARRLSQAPSEALHNAFALAESELRQVYENHPEDKSGSCACVGLLRGRRLFVASVGDCRMVLLRGEGSSESYVQLSNDHRATDPREHQRIVKAGGEIKDGRVWGALMPSRTLGDFPWKDRGPGLSAEPEIVEYEVTPDDKCARARAARAHAARARRGGAVAVGVQRQWRAAAPVEGGSTSGRWRRQWRVAAPVEGGSASGGWQL
jgi:hypothetical protein